MKTKRLNAFNLFVAGSVIMGLGICILSTSTLLFSALIYVFAVVFLVTGLFKLSQLLFGKRKEKTENITLSSALINLLAGLLLFLFPAIPMSIFAIGFGIYVFLLSLTHAIAFRILQKDKVKGRWTECVSCLFYLAFAIFLGFTPYMHMDLIMNVIGAYFVLYGFFYFKDLFREIVPASHKDILKRHVRISLPVLWQAILPKVVLDEVNRYLTPSMEKEIDAHSDFVQYRDEKSKADVEVFIHASSKGFGQLGHVDLCIQGEFLSYGNYDGTSYRLNETIGDGVLVIAHKEEYIPFVIQDSAKTLFCFGLKLNEVQKKRVLEQLQKIKDTLVLWNPPPFTGKDDVYSSRLLHSCPETSFYKFRKGRFKTYFVVKTNCVQLADYVVGSTGLDILNMNGIITPGAYYEYLDRQFSLHNEMVVYKKIYN